MFALENFLEATDRLFDRDVLSFMTGENFRHVKWLAEETLNLSCPVNGQFVFWTQLVHSKNRDDVLQIFVTLQNALHAACDIVMFFANNFRRERF